MLRDKYGEFPVFRVAEDVDPYNYTITYTKQKALPKQSLLYIEIIPNG